VKSGVVYFKTNEISREELIEYAIAQFELEADKIDALYDQ
jgi:hypothetical protein